MRTHWSLSMDRSLSADKSLPLALEAPCHSDSFAPVSLSSTIAFSPRASMSTFRNNGGKLLVSIHLPSVGFLDALAQLL